MSFQEVIEAYKSHVDRTQLIENLSLTPQQRSEKFWRAMQLVYELRRAAQVARQKPSPPPVREE
ncbi:MAG: hypothetical protein KDA92_01540 [Planctomycetales bacterium]|nr:hypothetical protein [Planctomycetales bacterium]MCA9170494.1 hypothetical protein [Planctomycetales bacterium]